MRTLPIPRPETIDRRAEQADRLITTRTFHRCLTMRLSDAGPRRQTKAVYSDHRLPPWLTEDAPRDRSNRLLGVSDMWNLRLLAG